MDVAAVQSVAANSSVLSPLVKDEAGEVGIEAMIRLPVTNVVRSTQLADNALGI